MADNILISVVIPAFNAENYIVRAIESCLGQTLQPFEIFVVDDGSTDKTAEIASQFTSPVQVIRRRNGGPGSARNHGIAAASGEWIALLDADDWWLPTKLERQIALRADNVGLIHCLTDDYREIPPSELAFKELWNHNWIINSSTLIRRSAFLTLGGFDEARELISAEDYNFWLRVAASDWTIVTCPEGLVHYTRGVGISSDAERLMAASFHNIDILNSRLGLTAALVKQKRAATFLQFGRQAIYERRMGRARTLLWQSFRVRPSPQPLIALGIATVPGRLLNLKRSVFRRSRKATKENAERFPFASVGPSFSGKISGGVSKPAAALRQGKENLAATEHIDRPILITTVDAEESFDWDRPLQRASHDVAAMRHQHRAHHIFARHRVVPVYLVDFPVASQDSGRGPLREILSDNQCEIGAQLHPWVTPPFVEHVSPHNSFAGNLPAAIEREKLRMLTGAIEDAFGTAPRVYRAGRYGFGANTGNLLKEFGYRVDTSVVPRWSFIPLGGPDFRDITAEPFWLDADRRLLEIPISAALLGGVSGLSKSVSSKLFDGLALRFRMPAIMARLKLLERVKLTPEGITIGEAKRLVRHMVAHGNKVFVLTYHSPSLAPGNTPYVRTEQDLERFLAWLDEFFDFFTSEIRGRCGSWQDVYASVLPSPR